jgi:Asp-tRNA(Asn)/Glu-tRNA(Gln) amidotransferase A subunit family amidase
LTKEAPDPRTRIDVICKRIEADEDKIGAFVPGTFDAERIRSQYDELLLKHPELSSRPPLFGSLLGVKDVINAEGFPTRCGSSLPANLFDGPEASCVTALRRAGAIVAGKTVTTEFAVSNRAPTRNPRNVLHTPGGSSSGSAAGVAAGFFPIALGTQTVGSTIRAAAYCGVIGFKPSFGRIPVDGVVPYSPSVDHIGLIVSDIDLLDPVMTAISVGWRGTRRDLRDGIKLGIPAAPYLDQAAPATRDHFDAVVKTLQAQGVCVKGVPAFGNIRTINEQLDRLTYGEISRVHREWLLRYRELYTPSTIAALALGADTSDSELIELRQVGHNLRLELCDLMRTHGIDAWAAPSAPDVAPKGLQWTGDPCMNAAWTYAGLPVLTIPSGENSAQLPYGLQLAGQFQSGEMLIGVASRLATLLGSGHI